MATNIFESLLPKSHSFHFEYIEDFKALSQEAQNYLIFETYKLFLASFRAFSYEDWINMFYNPNLLTVKLILLKDKHFNQVVGFSFNEVYSIKYLENDNSIENEYFTSNLIIAILEHYQRLKFGEKLFVETERLMRRAYPDKNRISANLVISPISIEIGYKMTSFYYPSLIPSPNEDIDRMYRKIKEVFNLQSPYEDKPYIAYVENGHVVGMDKKKFRANFDKLSSEYQYFLEQTGLKKGHVLFTLSVYNLVENNTLKLPAGNYERFADSGIEMKEFTNL